MNRRHLFKALSVMAFASVLKGREVTKIWFKGAPEGAIEISGEFNGGTVHFDDGYFFFKDPSPQTVTFTRVMDPNKW